LQEKLKTIDLNIPNELANQFIRYEDVNTLQNSLEKENEIGKSDMKENSKNQTISSMMSIRQY
jgi:hypothetical protein|tara:strand:- start:269 stop:457 length:189 start_codon:yes stop_codon:yes gene_type:complete